MQAENEICLAEKAFLTIDKVRCYNCHILGHYSNKCPIKRFKKKQQEVQLVEVPIDAQIITYPVADDDDAKEELYYFALDAQRVSVKDISEHLCSLTTGSEIQDVSVELKAISELKGSLTVDVDSGNDKRE